MQLTKYFFVLSLTEDFGPAQVVIQRPVGTTSFDVSWGISRAVDALGYRLQVVHVESGKTVYSQPNLGRGITKYTVNGLEPGNLYEVVVVVRGSDEIGSTRDRTSKSKIQICGKTFYIF